MIVEKDAARSSCLHGCLADQGYRILTADSCLAAHTLTESEPGRGVDVLLADAGMALLMGSNLARWIRRAGGRLKAVLVSEGESSQRPFPFRFLAMPFEAASLRAELEEALTPLPAAA